MSRCTAPIAFETMVSLWAGELTEAESEAAEAHLFGCDACSEAEERLGQLIGTIREVIPPVLSTAQRDRLQQRGLNIVQTRVEPNVAARARFAPGVDLLVHILEADVTHAERVDVDIVAPDGSAQISWEGVPFDAQTGEVLIACQRHYREMLPDGADPHFVLHAVEQGQRKTLGTYFVEHIWE